MPLVAAKDLLKIQLETAFNSGLAGNASLMALQITTAISSILPFGLFPSGSALIQPPPAGFSATQAQLTSAFSMSIAGKPEVTSSLIALAISALSPLVPPIGLSTLQTQLQQVFSMETAGNPSVSATMMSTAIIDYYTMGFVI